MNKDLDGEVKHGKNEESKDNHKEKKQAKYFCYFYNLFNLCLVFNSFSNIYVYDPCLQGLEAVRLKKKRKDLKYQEL